MIIDSEVKKSISFTLRIQVNYYYDKYSSLLEDVDSIDQLTDNIFFFWFRNSSKKHYYWTKSVNSISIIREDSELIKRRIKTLILERIKNDKKMIRKQTVRV